MLGNFSFGDYGSAEAIAAAWQFVTSASHGLAIPRDSLRVSVLQGDEATARLWRQIAGLDDTRIVRCPAADNFWSMGDGPGPCGPCTEIFVDQGREVDGDRCVADPH
jgi:alanyl-tRNA synthetase